ncbi:hypothetical protein FRX31_032575 [Thalictrum thalictroides]|uniref:Uncharacterized protein n=1 Tax=Thalictrum thalictroides TaxID=46969 RepID=A0A7J6UZH7_THATH|nr:hypothetical protein FRX31_032575 [Thalictrum thalictroides]
MLLKFKLNKNKLLSSSDQPQSSSDPPPLSCIFEENGEKCKNLAENCTTMCINHMISATVLSITEETKEFEGINEEENASDEGSSSTSEEEASDEDIQKVNEKEQGDGKKDIEEDNSESEKDSSVSIFIDDVWIIIVIIV